MKGSAAKIQMTSLDALFGGAVAQAADGQIQEIPLIELHPFKDHPFRVMDDEKMREMAESVAQYGVLVPGIVRPRPEGGYEIVAGHRRKRASELAGKQTTIENIAASVPHSSSSWGALAALFLMPLLVIAAIAGAFRGGGSAKNVNLSADVIALMPQISAACQTYGIPEYVPLVAAVIMQESGGRVADVGGDVMQCAEGMGFGRRHGRGQRYCRWVVCLPSTWTQLGHIPWAQRNRYFLCQLLR